MGKPDWCPQDVWDKAESHRQLWARGPASIKEAVARAILAAKAEEREACAEAAFIPLQSYVEAIQEGDSSAAVTFLILKGIQYAIRKRGEA
jgi:hypothetical protein